MYDYKRDSKCGVWTLSLTQTVSPKRYVWCDIGKRMRPGIMLLFKYFVKGKTEIIVNLLF